MPHKPQTTLEKGLQSEVRFSDDRRRSYEMDISVQAFSGSQHFGHFIELEIELLFIRNDDIQRRRRNGALKPSDENTMFASDHALHCLHAELGCEYAIERLW